MSNYLANIEVGLAEYNFFQELSSNEKFFYLTEIYDIEQKKSEDTNIVDNLQTFFDDLTELQQYDVLNSSGEDFSKVDVLVDNENLVLESNSLRAVRHIKYRFMDDGYLLIRDSEAEKLFKKDKITRYLRVYKIIGRVFHLCYN